MKLLLAYTLALVGRGLAAFHDRRQVPDPASFDWYALTPAENITWTSCFGDQQCARLHLPLDYSKPAGPKTQIALQIIPATDKANYQGSILVNPGGPANSGTLFVLEAGPALAQLFGPTFDILGFDPRGTGATTPLAMCFDSPQELDAWALREVVALHVDDASIPLARARDELLAALCASRLGGNGREDISGSAEDWGIGRFMDTANVATDMFHIVEKLGQSKLHYYGGSYGTLLGQYFAALYPHMVGRMILDGIVDGAGLQGTGYFEPTEDADRVMDAFFSDCVSAGPLKCTIWRETSAAVARHVDYILSTLRDSPIDIPLGLSSRRQFSEDDALSVIFQALWSPLDGFPLLSSTFQAIELRDADFLAQLGLPTPSAGLAPWLQRNEASTAIACSDFPPFRDLLSDEIALVRNATTLSRWAGPFMFSRWRITCGAWRIRAKQRYTGPVSASLDVPVLVVSNRVDPVTPLSSALAVVPRFTGMRLLIQDTVRHTASASLSICVAVAMNAYMTTGTLPPFNRPPAKSDRGPIRNFDFVGSVYTLKNGAVGSVYLEGRLLPAGSGTGSGSILVPAADQAANTDVFPSKPCTIRC